MKIGASVDCQGETNSEEIVEWKFSAFLRRMPSRPPDFASGSAEGGVGRFPDKFRTAPPRRAVAAALFFHRRPPRGCVVAREFGISSASSAV